MARGKILSLQDKIEACEKEVADLQERKAELLQACPQTEERKIKLGTLQSLQATRAAHEQELKTFAENDPETKRRIQQAAKEAKLACERWTDNTQAVSDWLKKSVSISRKEADRQMGIPDDFDYPVYYPK